VSRHRRAPNQPPDPGLSTLILSTQEAKTKKKKKKKKEKSTGERDTARRLIVSVPLLALAVAVQCLDSHMTLL
jgi:hypothetical protein